MHYIFSNIAVILLFWVLFLEFYTYDFKSYASCENVYYFYTIKTEVMFRFTMSFVRSKFK